jgi:hypothetical protein
MKFQCPHCRQDLDVDAQWVGYEANCPSCGRAVLVPARSLKALSIATFETKPKSSSTTNYKVASGGGGFVKFLVIFFLLAGAAFAFATPTQDNGSGASIADSGGATSKGAFIHPGLLHSDADFARMKEHLHEKPWDDGWEKLIANPHSSLAWTPRPVAVVVRGRGALPQNYGLLYNDIAAAYACALRWRISGDHLYADKSVEIMNVWSAKLTKLTGTTDVYLLAGFDGYEFSNTAEIMRSYDGWKPEDFARFQAMMLNVFYPINHDFLMRHNGGAIDHYWANWDAGNMASMIAIGVLCDRRDIYNEAVDYFKHGGGNGAIEHAVYYIHPDGLGQWQESGRDQGHTVLGIGAIGAFCEMAWKQGDDLYGYDNNRFLAGCEYVAKYNLGEDVPYKPFQDSLATQDVISTIGRGIGTPVWELVYNHYVKLKGLPAPYVTKAAEGVRPEGGGGDYGPNSGGFDQLGYGTLTFTLDAGSSAKASDSTIH